MGETKFVKNVRVLVSQFGHKKPCKIDPLPNIPGDKPASTNFVCSLTAQAGFHYNGLDVIFIKGLELCGERHEDEAKLRIDSVIRPSKNFTQNSWPVFELLISLRHRLDDSRNLEVALLLEVLADQRCLEKLIVGRRSLKNQTEVSPRGMLARHFLHEWLRCRLHSVREQEPRP